MASRSTSMLLLSLFSYDKAESGHWLLSCSSLIRRRHEPVGTVGFTRGASLCTSLCFQFTSGATRPAVKILPPGIPTALVDRVPTGDTCGGRGIRCLLFVETTKRRTGRERGAAPHIGVGSTVPGASLLRFWACKASDHVDKGRTSSSIVQCSEVVFVRNRANVSSFF